MSRVSRSEILTLSASVRCRCGLASASPPVGLPCSAVSRSSQAPAAAQLDARGAPAAAGPRSSRRARHQRRVRPEAARPPPVAPCPAAAPRGAGRGRAGRLAVPARRRAPRGWRSGCFALGPLPRSPRSPGRCRRSARGPTRTVRSSPPLRWPAGLARRACCGARSRPRAWRSIAAAWPILGWAVVQRSFGSLRPGQATPRLSQPFGYPNAVGHLQHARAAGGPVARHPPAARAARAAAGRLALPLYALPLTGSRGSLARGPRWRRACSPGCSRRRVECAAALVAASWSWRPLPPLWTLSLPPSTSSSPAVQPSAGAALLLVGLAASWPAPPARPCWRSAPSTACRGRDARAAAAAPGTRRSGLLVLVATPSAARRPDRRRPPRLGRLHRRRRRHHRARPARESRHEHARALVERGLARVPGPALAGWGAGTFSIVDPLRRPDLTPAGETHTPACTCSRGSGCSAASRRSGALVASGWAAHRRLPQAVRREPGRGRRALAGLAAFALHNQLDWDWSFLALTLAAFPLAGCWRQPAARPASPRATAAASAAAAIALPALGLAAMHRPAPLPRERASAGREPRPRAGDAAAAGNALGAATAESALVELDLARGFEPVSYTRCSTRPISGRARPHRRRAGQLSGRSASSRAPSRPGCSGRSPAGARPDGEGLRDAALRVQRSPATSAASRRCGRGRLPDRLMPRPG